MHGYDSLIYMKHFDDEQQLQALFDRLSARLRVNKPPEFDWSLIDSVQVLNYRTTFLSVQGPKQLIAHTHRPFFVWSYCPGFAPQAGSCANIFYHGVSFKLFKIQ